MRMLKTTEAALRLGVSTQTVRNLIKSKRLPAVDISHDGKRSTYLVREVDLDLLSTPAELRPAIARTPTKLPRLDDGVERRFG